MSFNRVFDYFLNGLSPEVHRGKDLLENAVDDVSEDECIVDVCAGSLELLGKVRFASARERLHDLGRRNHNVWLNDDHAGLAIESVRVNLVGIVIDL